MIGTHNDMELTLRNDMLSDDDALIPVVDVSQNITVDPAVVGENFSQLVNTTVVGLLAKTKLRTHEALVAKHTAWEYSRNLTVGRKASLLSRANYDPDACTVPSEIQQLHTHSSI